MSKRVFTVASALPLALLAPLAAVAFVAAACPQAQGPTYHQDIAPMIATSCAQCHQDGGIAPFPLVSYADAQAHAQEIAFAVSSRLMPPSNIDASGTCRTFENGRWLTDDQIQTFQDWADAGAPEGDDVGPPPALPTVPSLEDANVFVEMSEEYLPHGDAEHPNDDYRCFLVDGPEEDGYVTGFEILPGQPQEVHHMIIVGTLDQQTEQAAQDLDDSDPGPGFTCFANFADGNVNFLAGWAPGKNVVEYPKGTGLFVKGGRKLVMQIHYNLLAGAPVPDVTGLKLRTQPTVEKEAAIALIADTDLDVPPGQRSGKFEFSYALAGMTDDIDIYGVFPHMHQLGQTLRFSVHPLNDDKPEDDFCMADVWRWDFHWQELFLYDQPVRVRASDVIDIACTYDTMGRSTDVVWGEGTQDEMCLVGVYVARPNGGPLSELFP